MNDKNDHRKLPSANLIKSDHSCLCAKKKAKTKKLCKGFICDVLCKTIISQKVEIVLIHRDSE